MNSKEYIIKLLNEAKSDNLERAEAAWGSHSQALLDTPYGKSGKTRREILEQYRAERRMWQEAIDWIKSI